MATRDPREPFSRINVAEAKELLSGDGAALIDVREPHEWEEGHVAGATLIPVNSIFARAAELPNDKELIFICRTGARSALAAEMVAATGAKNNLNNLEGGIVAWIVKPGSPSNSRRFTSLPGRPSMTTQARPPARRRGMSLGSRFLLAGVVVTIGAIIYALATGAFPFIGGDDNGGPAAPEITPGAGPARELPKTDFVFGSVTYQVTDQKDEDSLGEGVAQGNAKGRFHVVILNVRNDAPEPLQFGVESFALYDEKGRRYSANEEASAAAAGDFSAEDPFGEPLQPGLTAAWAIAFDVPDDALKLILRISQGFIEVDLTPDG